MYKNTKLNFPKTLIVDDGKEFYSEVTKLMEKHDVIIQRGDPSQHRSQGIVERYNKTLADNYSVTNTIKNLKTLQKVTENGYRDYRMLLIL